MLWSRFLEKPLKTQGWNHRFIGKLAQFSVEPHWAIVRFETHLRSLSPPHHMTYIVSLTFWLRRSESVMFPCFFLPGNRGWSVGYFRKCPNIPLCLTSDTRLCPHCYYEAFTRFTCTVKWVWRKRVNAIFLKSFYFGKLQAKAKVE